MSNKKVFYNHTGIGYTFAEMCSMVDYHERTGDYTDEFNDDDFDRFYKTYIIPFREGVSDERFLNK